MLREQFKGAQLDRKTTHKVKNSLNLDEKPINSNIQIDENKQKQRNYYTLRATVARKSAKLPQTSFQATPLPKKPKKPDENRKETESSDRKEDKRIFLRLGPDHA